MRAWLTWQDIFLARASRVDEICTTATSRFRHLQDGAAVYPDQYCQGPSADVLARRERGVHYIADTRDDFFDLLADAFWHGEEKRLFKKYPDLTEKSRSLDPRTLDATKPKRKKKR